HYLWFREGKGLTRQDYARLVTALLAGGAAAAASAVEGGASEVIAIPASNRMPLKKEGKIGKKPESQKLKVPSKAKAV
ncbi:MAG: hypothetical protein B7Y01_03735, partial [Xanthobacter sp. 17-67-6]